MAEEAVDTLYHLFRGINQLLLPREKPPMPSFTSLVLDLRFTHGRKSRQFPLSFILKPNYASHIAEESCRLSLFPFFRGRNKLPSSREMPPMSSFTCSVLDLRFTHGRRNRQCPLSFILKLNYASHTSRIKSCRMSLFHFFGGRTKLPSSREMPPMPSFTCSVLDLRDPHGRTTRRRHLSLV